jgi:hypothetical protein
MKNDIPTLTVKIEPVRREHAGDIIDLLQHMSVFQPSKKIDDNFFFLLKKKFLISKFIYENSL